MVCVEIKRNMKKNCMLSAVRDDAKGFIYKHKGKPRSHKEMDLKHELMLTSSLIFIMLV